MISELVCTHFKFKLCSQQVSQWNFFWEMLCWRLWRTRLARVNYISTFNMSLTEFLLSHVTLPCQSNSFSNLDVWSASCTIQGGDSFNGKTWREILGVSATAKVLHHFAHGAITFDFIIDHSWCGQCADQHSWDNHEHFHCFDFFFSDYTC